MIKAPTLTAPTLPELVMVDCPECGNDGGCETCAGMGRLEVCSVCRAVPTVRNGVDACGCPQVVELGRVA